MNYKQNLHNALLIFKDGVDLLVVSDQIETIIEDEKKISNKEGYDEGYAIGYENGMRADKAITGVAGVGICLLALGWIIGGIKGCNESNHQNALLSIKRQEQMKPKIESYIKACSDGDYSTCRTGWLEFNTDEYQSYNGRYATCSSFEEAYYNKTHSMLVLTGGYFKK